MPIKHAFTNPKSDGADATIVRPSDWNADHVITGKVKVVLPTGVRFEGSASGSPTTTGFLVWVNIPGDMDIAALAFAVSASGTGTYQWGLFDYSSDPTSCTKLAGGSGAVGGTGWREIAATGAPVAVAAGNYALIWQTPASNAATLYRDPLAVTPTFSQNNTSYSWDDTPDITTGWSDLGLIYCVALTE